MILVIATIIIAIIIAIIITISSGDVMKPVTSVNMVNTAKGEFGQACCLQLLWHSW